LLYDTTNCNVSATAVKDAVTDQSLDLMLLLVLLSINGLILSQQLMC